MDSFYVYSYLEAGPTEFIMQVMRCIRASTEGGAKKYIADLIIKESNSHINKM